MLLEASRRLPADFASSRFINSAELITPPAEPLSNDQLQPAEGYLLSRLDRAMPLHDVVAISGLGETETLRLVYSLALGGLLQRESWKSTRKPVPPPPTPEPAPQDEPIDVEKFLEKVRTAATFYEVLGVSGPVSAQSLKDVYYELARRYHPDRFRKSE